MTRPQSWDLWLSSHRSPGYLSDQSSAAEGPAGDAVEASYGDLPMVLATVRILVTVSGSRLVISFSQESRREQRVAPGDRLPVPMLLVAFPSVLGCLAGLWIHR